MEEEEGTQISEPHDNSMHGRGRHHIHQDLPTEMAAAVWKSDDVSMDTLASSKGLSWETTTMLKQQGINSLEMLRSLTPDAIALLTQGSGYLPERQLGAMKELVRELQTSVEGADKGRSDVSSSKAHDVHELETKSEGLKGTLRADLHQKPREEVIPSPGLCQLTTYTHPQPVYNPLMELTTKSKLSTSLQTSEFSGCDDNNMHRRHRSHLLQDPHPAMAAAVTVDDVSMDTLASSKGLSWETKAMLKQQGINSLEMLRSLTPDAIALLTQGSGYLPERQLGALKELVRELQTSVEGADKGRSDVSSSKETEPSYFDPLPFSWRGSSDYETFRFLLVGKTGCGKSTTGNTILGKKLFRSELCFSLITGKCMLEKSVHKGICIEIVDSPGLCDTKRSLEDVASEVVQFVLSMHPGPTAILYVIEIRRYTEEDESVFNRLKSLLDERVAEYIIIIFTRGDELRRENKKISEALASAPENLQKVLKECGNRYVVFDNMAEDKQPQVDRLLQEVRKLIQVHDGKPYSCPKYNKVGKKFEEELERRLQEMKETELRRNTFVTELEEIKRLQEKAKTEARDLERKEKEKERNIRKAEAEKQMTLADRTNDNIKQTRKEMEKEIKLQQEQMKILLKKEELALKKIRLEYMKMQNAEQWQLKKEVANADAKQSARCNVM